MSSLSPPFITKALYPYKSDFEDDLNFGQGQLIQVTAIEDDEWYTGNYKDESGAVRSGMFPKNFVSEPVKETTQSHQEDSHEKEDGQAIDRENVTESVESPLNTAPEAASPNKDAVSPNVKQAVLDKDVSIEPEPKSTPLKGLGSRISTFDTEREAAILPSTGHLNNSNTSNKSYKGLGSSYIPASFGGNKHQTSYSSVKKPDFSHSSYVPPPLGKSNDTHQNSSSAASVSAPQAQQPVSASSELKQEEEEGPKLSLKERIALLQKQQAEEAERQAALASKKHQKKERQQLHETPTVTKIPQEKTVTEQNVHHDSGSLKDGTEPTVPEARIEEGVQSEDLEVEPQQRQPPIPIERQVEQDLEDDSVSRRDDEYDDESADEKNVYSEERAQDNAAVEKVVDEEEDDDDEDEEDEEDEEEAKRTALRERMARLAGAGGLFGTSGVGGFNPFGGVPSSGSKPKKTKPQKEIHHDDEEAEAEKENYSSPAPVPILPFVAGSAPQIPKALQHHDTVYEEQDSIQEEQEVNDLLTKDLGPESPVLRKNEVETIVKDDITPTPADEEAVLIEKELQDDEDFHSIEEAQDRTLVEKLAKIDLSSARPNNNISESAIEGDDEEEKSTSDEENFIFTDEGHEKTQTNASQVSPIHSIVTKQDQSDHTSTGYESDDDTQQIDTSAPKVPVSPTVQSIPPIPSNIPPPQIPQTIPSQHPEPFSRSAPSVPHERSTLISSHGAPPIPPIPSNLSSPPVPSHIATVIDSPTSHEPTAPQGVPPIPQGDSSNHGAPSIPRRASHRESHSGTKRAPPPPPAPSASAPHIPPPPTESAPHVPPPRVAPISIPKDVPPPLPSSPSVPAPPIPYSASPSSPLTAAPPIPDLNERVIRRSSTVSNRSLSRSIKKSDTFHDYSVDDVDHHHVEKHEDLDLNDKWWVTNQLPKKYSNHKYKLDQDVVVKRFNKKLYIKNYYILKHDYSQLNLQIIHDDFNWYNLSKFEIPAPLTISTNNDIAELVSTNLNKVLKHSSVLEFLSGLRYVKSGEGITGIPINKHKDVKKGDLLNINGELTIHNKFKSSKKLKLYNYFAIIWEFDDIKQKFRVLEIEDQKLKQTSFKVGELTKGEFKVFRLVTEKDIGW